MINLMEEDIKLLIKFINYNKFYKEKNNGLTITISEPLKSDIDKAIKNVLTRNKELEERSDRINKQNIEYRNTLEKLQKNTICKSKVKEKIEELEKDIEIHNIYEENWNKIEVLQELLED